MVIIIQVTFKVLQCVINCILQKSIKRQAYLRLQNKQKVKSTITQTIT